MKTRYIYSEWRNCAWQLLQRTMIIIAGNKSVGRSWLIATNVSTPQIKRTTSAIRPPNTFEWITCEVATTGTSIQSPSVLNTINRTPTINAQCCGENIRIVIKCMHCMEILSLTYPTMYVATARTPFIVLCVKMISTRFNISRHDSYLPGLEFQYLFSRWCCAQMYAYLGTVTRCSVTLGLVDSL